jgi:hypothetical protein
LSRKPTLLYCPCHLQVKFKVDTKRSSIKVVSDHYIALKKMTFETILSGHAIYRPEKSNFCLFKRQICRLHGPLWYVYYFEVSWGTTHPIKLSTYVWYILYSHGTYGIKCIYQRSGPLYLSICNSLFWPKNIKCIPISE